LYIYKTCAKKQPESFKKKLIAVYTFETVEQDGQRIKKERGQARLKTLLEVPKTGMGVSRCHGISRAQYSLGFLRP
jgi:hypothetical protein